MPINKDPITPPPTIGKIGPYTVFVTPPSTPKPAEPPVIESPQKVVAPPVQPPPQQFEKPVSVQSLPDGSVSGFFKNAVNKVQNAHSSLDDHLARIGKGSCKSKRNVKQSTECLTCLLGRIYIN
ncbi:hypothetical protein QYF36_018010 [Acer negundo]|nr:hypothetical protein QYF36_018010 [Acer negundo]